jgi:magnesium transporter
MMSRKGRAKRSGKIGLPPGSLVHTGADLPQESKATVIDYDAEQFSSVSISGVAEIEPYLARDTTTWINVEGLSNVGLLGELGNLFDIHPLILEDILSTHQRPKFEEYEDHLYIVANVLSLQPEPLAVKYEQVSILLMEKVIITFMERPSDLLTPLRRRLQNSNGRIRTFGVDYLAYALLDIVVDHNFILIDSFEDLVEKVEEDLFRQPSQQTLVTIQKLKGELIAIRRMIVPLRDLVSSLLRSDSELISERTSLYLRDVLDHVIRIGEAVESYREILASLLDIYMSTLSNKMNEVMKVLTIFASIFIPLTFLAGIYGMNFDYMPELHYRWSYPLLWVLFLLIPAVLLVYFRKRRWL